MVIHCVLLLGFKILIIYESYFICEEYPHSSIWVGDHINRPSNKTWEEMSSSLESNKRWDDIILSPLTLNQTHSLGIQVDTQWVVVSQTTSLFVVLTSWGGGGI
jgi:hypothetical protein